MEKPNEAELLQILNDGAAGQQQIQAMLELATLKRFSDNEAARKYTLQAVEAATEINDEELLALSQLKAAMIFADFEISLKYAKKALEYFRKSNNLTALARCMNVMGSAYLSVSDQAGALDILNRGLEVAKASKDISVQSSILGNLARVHDDLGDTETSIHYSIEAIQLSESIQEYYNLSVFYGNLANIYSRTGNYDKSILYAQKSLECQIKLNNRAGINRAYGIIGITHYRNGNYPQALEYFDQSLELAKQAEDFSHWGLTLMNKGLIYQKKNFENYSLSKAENYFQEAFALYAKHRIPLKNLTSIYNQLGELCEEQGRLAEALKYYKEYWRISSENRNEETKRKAAQSKIRQQMLLVENEMKVTEKILHNILPKTIAEKIKNGEEKIIQRFDSASVLFADMVGFTVWSSKRDVNEVADTLNVIFNLFDELAVQFGIEKIKTIGDAYMCVAGLPEPCADHALRMAHMALAMNHKIKHTYPNGEITLRIGIHCGEVIAGVLGKNKYAYDLWGDTVNTASRMESHGEPGKIQVSEDFRKLLADKFQFEERGVLEIKGKGMMNTWFLNG